MNLKVKYLRNIIVIIFAISTTNGNSQFSIDLGPIDKFICANGSGTVFKIGDSLTITGGTPPYTYRWESSYTIVYVGWRTFYSYASDYLSDTSIANPTILNYSNDSLFYLYVTDSNGNVAVDSIKLRVSSFFYHLGYMHHSINSGDSVRLNFGNVSGGIYPIKYIWRPNHGLTDSTSKQTWAFPTQNTNYAMSIIDSTGCFGQGAAVHWVTVNHVGLNENNISDQIKIFPNPATEFISVSLSNDKELCTYSIYSIEGKLFTEIKSQKSLMTFDVNKFPSGEYIIHVKTQAGEGFKKFIIL